MRTSTPSPSTRPWRGRNAPGIVSRLAGASLLLLLIAGCSSSAGTGASNGRATTSTGRPVDAVVLDVLDNIKANGLNAEPALNNGLGGLWINWRFGTEPLQANVNTSGKPNGDLLHHDYLTDLRYLHALWLFKASHPADTQFDGQNKRFTEIVKAEFARPAEDHGWVYDEFIDLYRLSGDEFYRTAARSLAEHYSRLFHDQAGAIYWTSADHPSGYYYADRALEIGSALIQAGTTFAQPTWASDGARAVQFVYQHAYLPQDHVFLWGLDNVLLPDGSANPNETIMRPQGALSDEKLAAHLIRDGGVVEPDEQAHIALSFLHVASLTGDRSFLARAQDILDPLRASSNQLGLWDPAMQGYFGAAIFPGPDFAHPGAPHVIRLFKESGRQVQLLEAFHVADQALGGRYRDMEAAMKAVATGPAYYAPGHGYLYEQTADWQPLTLKNGVVSDWVTTEAMGCALEGLLSLDDPRPW